MVVVWNQECKGWQTRPLDSDCSARGWQGEDGYIYNGFVESGMLCDVDGEVLSRCSGLSNLYQDAPW